MFIDYKLNYYKCINYPQMYLSPSKSLQGIQRSKKSHDNRSEEKIVGGHTLPNNETFCKAIVNSVFLQTPMKQWSQERDSHIHKSSASKQRIGLQNSEKGQLFK